jgi:phosphate transport system substrate-binding protein
VENIPILISYQYICYNVPGVSTGLNLSANIIAGIYMGTITNWNSSLIQAANPHATLPNHSIVPVHRSDGSGDTFMFTSFLAHGNATWGSKYHFGTSASIFPAVSGELTGAQNTGIINAVNATRYSIGYIAATYQTEINNDHFGIANLENKAGFFVAPTVANVKAAASGYLSSIPSNGSIALQYAPGNNSYPIADMEYVVVQLHQSSTSVANALKDFLTWVLSPSGGSQTKYLSAMNLVALPSNVVASVSQPMINKITG